MKRSRPCTSIAITINQARIMYDQTRIISVQQPSNYNNHSREILNHEMITEDLKPFI